MKKRYLASVCAVGLLMGSQSALADCKGQQAYAYVQCSTMAVPKMIFKICNGSDYCKLPGLHDRWKMDTTSNKCMYLVGLLNKLNAQGESPKYSIYSVTGKHIDSNFEHLEGKALPQNFDLVEDQEGPYLTYLKEGALSCNAIPAADR